MYAIPARGVPDAQPGVCGKKKRQNTVKLPLMKALLHCENWDQIAVRTSPTQEAVRGAPWELHAYDPAGNSSCVPDA